MLGEGDAPGDGGVLGEGDGLVEGEPLAEGEGATGGHALPDGLAETEGAGVGGAGDGVAASAGAWSSTAPTTDSSAEQARIAGSVARRRSDGR